MSDIDRLIACICARPPEARFGDVQRLLEAFGWTLANERGSHVTFKKPGEHPLVVIKRGGRMVKRTYLDRIAERLGLDERP